MTCARCGKTDCCVVRRDTPDHNSFVLCYDCADSYDKHHKDFVSRFLSSKPERFWWQERL